MLEEVTYGPYSEEKLAELLLYIAKRLQQDPQGGATKLNKCLYFADFSAVRRLGHPITGAEYQRLPQGPAPRRLRPVRDRLLRSGEALLEERTDSFGYRHHDLIPVREPRTDVFSEDELAVVDEVLAALDAMNAAQVSELSHRDAGWQLVREGETIPYELAFVLAPEQVDVTPAMRKEGRRLLAEYGDRLA
jgi:hypothetical protein